jgi:hypothetical protein
MRQQGMPPGRTKMYGPYVRDKFPSRNHLPSILDIEIDHHRKRHILAWLMLAGLAVAGIAAGWYAGIPPH